MRLLVRLLACLVLPATAIAAADPPTPSQLGTLFCKAALSGRVELIRPFLNPGVEHALVLDEGRGVALPLESGAPWQVIASDEDRCDVLYIIARKTYREIGIAHTFGLSPEADFTDVLIVTGGEFDLRIEDIRRQDRSRIADNEPAHAGVILGQPH